MARLRWGPGPVFVHESIAATRRWQLYASRALFVLGLLGGLALAWYTIRSSNGGTGQPDGSVTIRQLASLGQSIYYAISTVQIALVLLVAPAATAGSICLDRARGTLTHMCVTDLTDSEIVLGKLAARLLPVLSLVMATIPVLALAGLLGGVVIEAIVALTLITVSLAVLGCSLAMAISVRATRTHEVLMAVYGIEALWILGPVIWQLLADSGMIRPSPTFLMAINPFVLAWAPYAWPNYLTNAHLLAVLGGTVAASAGLVLYAVLRLRGDLTRRHMPITRLASWLSDVRAKLTSWRPGPSLDKDPVLWREWRRGRPSRVARVVWASYLALAVAGTAWGIMMISENQPKGSQFLQLVNGLEATFGLMLVSLAAPTVLAEERVRGSLDVLLATPLSTDGIVLSKWWGIYRVVPALALLPAIAAVFMAAAEPSLPPIPRAPAAGYTPIPLTTVDRLAHAYLPTAMLLAQGALVTSVGLALSTWISRVGRAVALSIVTYVSFAFGWIIFLELGIVEDTLKWLGLLQINDSEDFVELLFLSACPIGGQICAFQSAISLPEESRGAFSIAEIIIFLITLVVALIVLGLTLATFDHFMGRVPERARRPRHAPRAKESWFKTRRRADDVRRPDLMRLNA